MKFLPRSPHSSPPSCHCKCCEFRKPSTYCNNGSRTIHNNNTTNGHIIAFARTSTQHSKANRRDKARDAWWTSRTCVKSITPSAINWVSKPRIALTQECLSVSRRRRRVISFVWKPSLRRRSVDWSQLHAGFEGVPFDVSFRQMYKLLLPLLLGDYYCWLAPSSSLKGYGLFPVMSQSIKW